jgi:hypothetical protein
MVQGSNPCAGTSHFFVFKTQVSGHSALRGLNGFDSRFDTKSDVYLLYEMLYLAPCRPEP